MGMMPFFLGGLEAVGVNAVAAFPADFGSAVED